MEKGATSGGSKPSAADVNSSQYCDSLLVFTSALENFQQAVPDDLRATFKTYPDAPSMVQAIRDHVEQNPEKSRLLRCCKKISTFAQGMRPFFEVVDIFVSSHPEYAALAWGAVRLVFKLCSHYATFFEKLADMFERLATKLPRYARHIELLKKRAALFKFADRNQELMKSLALVYTDIMQFCQEACQIFSAKHRSVRYRIVRDLFWKPFDNRFSDILGRLQKHEELYELELNIVEKEEMLQHYEDFQAELNEVQNFRETQRREARSKEARCLAERIRDLKTWIKAPDYMDALERERARLSENSGTWLLQQAAYTCWQQSWEGSLDGSSPSPPRDLASRTLFIQGSPGYGKTALSAVVIDHIQSIDSTVSATSVGQGTVFFHFDKMNPELHRSDRAFRALLSQLVHQNQRDRELVDTASILMDIDGTGQRVASEGDVTSVLQVALTRRPFTLIVIDGVDECAEPTAFLKKLQTICAPAKCWLLLLGRPGIQLPQAFLHCEYFIRLPRGANINDIRTYARSHLEDLRNNEYLPTNVDLDYLVPEIAERSESLFLWIKLFVDYLASPALSPRDRMEALEHVNLLEGLDALFERILSTITQGPRHNKKMAFRAFQWLAASQNPLQSSELRAALAIRIGQTTNPHMDYIVDFKNSIVQICGALVEIREDGSIHFIHLSVREFLTSDTFQVDRPSLKEFYVHVPTAHISVAAGSLSYLLHDVPNQPLSGSSKIQPCKSDLETQFPLLRCGIQFWSHITEGIEALGGNETNTSYLEECQVLGNLLTRFLETKAAVTVWVEAMWTFSPNAPVKELADKLQAWQKTRNTTRAKNASSSNGGFSKVIALTSDISEFAAELEYLAREWKRVLKDQPSEIWEPSIGLFFESKFMVRATETHASQACAYTISSGEADAKPEAQYLDAGEGISWKLNHEKMLLSQVSMDGRMLGAVSMIPSKEYIERHLELWRLWKDSDDIDDTDDDNADENDEGGNESVDYGNDDDHFPLQTRSSHDTAESSYESLSIESTVDELLHAGNHGDFPRRNHTCNPRVHTLSPSGSSSHEKSTESSDIGDNEFPRSNMRKMLRIVKDVSSGWKVRYQIRHLDANSERSVGATEIFYEIPHFDIIQMIVLAFHNADQDFSRNFCITVSISPDLMTLSVMHSVIKVTNESFQSQILDEELLAQSISSISSNPLLIQTPRFMGTEGFWLHASMSSNGKYLASVRCGPHHTWDISENENRPYFYDCTVVIFEDQSSEVGNIHYEPIRQAGPFEDFGGVEIPIAFHPSQPLMSFVADDKTCLWLFSDKESLVPRAAIATPPLWRSSESLWAGHGGSWFPYSATESFRRSCPLLAEKLAVGDLPRVLHQRGLDGVGFCPSGKTVSGRDRSQRIVTINVDELYPPHKCDSKYADGQGAELLSGLIASQGAPRELQMHLSGTVSLRAGSMTMHASSVRQYDEYGAVMLESFDDIGPSRSAELLRIPESIILEGSQPVLLRSLQPSSTVRIVLNKAAERTYDFMEPSGFRSQLPLVVERDIESIPVFEHRAALESGGIEEERHLLEW